MCGPVQGAIAGAIAYEGWAATPEEGAALAASGEVALEPCHHHGAVGPMAGIISPSMPLFVVENSSGGNRAYCNFNEGLGKVLRFGANRPDVLDRLRWMGTRAVRRAAGRRARAGRRRAAADHGAGAAHGRRGPQPQRRRDRPAVQAPRPGAAHRRSPGRRRAPRDRVRRRQRPLLPEPLDGGLQGDARRGARRRAQHDGHRDGPQRRELRDPLQRHRRRLVSGPRQPGRRPVLPRLRRRRRRRRPRRQRDHRDGRRRRVRDGRGARDRAVRRRHARRRDGEQPAHAGDHAGHAPAPSRCRR